MFKLPPLPLPPSSFIAFYGHISTKYPMQFRLSIIEEPDKKCNMRQLQCSHLFDVVISEASLNLPSKKKVR